MSNTITTEWKEKIVMVLDDSIAKNIRAGDLPEKILAIMESYANDRVKERIGEILPEKTDVRKLMEDNKRLGVSKDVANTTEYHAVVVNTLVDEIKKRAGIEST